MKNLSDFKSFVSSLNESVLDWDPKKAETAIKKAMEQTGGSTKDKLALALKISRRFLVKLITLLDML